MPKYTITFGATKFIRVPGDDDDNLAWESVQKEIDHLEALLKVNFDYVDVIEQYDSILENEEFEEFFDPKDLEESETRYGDMLRELWPGPKDSPGGGKPEQPFRSRLDQD